MSRRMTPNERALQRYSGVAAGDYHERKRAVPEMATPWLWRVRAERLAQSFGAADDAFEFGCGFGWNLGGIRCSRKVGYDVDATLRSSVEAAGAHFVADPAELADETFDVALCHHSLEHLVDPVGALVLVHRLLRPSGRLVVAVPYDRERRWRRFDALEPNRHLYSWTPQTLGALATVCGFDVRRVGLRRYGYDRRAALLAVRWRLGEPGFRALRALAQSVRPLYETALVAGRAGCGS